jgi:hypothetical protein
MAEQSNVANFNLGFMVISLSVQQKENEDNQNHQTNR